MRRILYFLYYIKKLNKELFVKFTNHIHRKENLSKLHIYISILLNSFRYNISILEYFQFGFYSKSHFEKLKWAGTGHMYEYQLKMNPKKYRNILDDKTQFYKSYSKFFIHLVADLTDLTNNEKLAFDLLNNKSGKIVFKVLDGKCGVGIEIKKASDYTVESLIKYLKESQFDLVEEYIIQHSDLNKLSSSAVNTIRIFTQLNSSNEVEILGCRQRISVNSNVDNMAAGNLAAPIDEHTGKIYANAVYSDICKSEEEYHPVTKVKFKEFQVPFWTETIEMTKKAALLHPQNRSIGWDIVITSKGPGLIEGNHDWCKLLWQLPVKQGLKDRLRIS